MRPGYAWQRTKIHGRPVIYLGFLHSIWGDVAGRVVTRLAELTGRPLAADAPHAPCRADTGQQRHDGLCGHGLCRRNARPRGRVSFSRTDAAERQGGIPSSPVLTLLHSGLASVFVSPCRARIKDTKVRSGPAPRSRQDTAGVVISSIQCILKLADVYDRVVFPEE